MFKDGIMPGTVGYKNDLKYGFSSRYPINMGRNKCFKIKMELILSLGHCHPQKMYCNLFSISKFAF